MHSVISIVFYLLFVAFLYIFDNLLLFFVLSSLGLLLLLLLPQKQLKSGFIPISIFLLATFLANILFSPGKILLKAGPFAVTEEGVHIATLRALRVFLLIAGAKFLTVITGLNEMVRTMGKILSPLEKIGVPVREFFETMALAVNALPHLRKKMGIEYGRRMSGLDRRTVYERIRIVFGFLLPVFIESIRNPESIFSEVQGVKNNDRGNEPYGGQGKGMEDTNG